MRYLLGFLVTVGLIILLIVLLFHGGGQKVPKTSKTLDSYASTDAAVSLLIDGPINAASQHNQISISVDRDNVTYEQLQGYDGSVVNVQHFPNSENAYDVFLNALTKAGFTKASTDKTAGDVRGYCSLGSRYIFRLTQDGHDIEHLWATSCGKPRTYLGSVGLTVQLFQAQVPGYSDLTNNIPLE